MNDNIITGSRAQNILSLCMKYDHRLPEEIAREVIAFKNNEALKTPIEIYDLELSVRAFNIISSAGCKTIADILCLGEEGLARRRNCGRITVDEIKAELIRNGFTLPKHSNERLYVENKVEEMTQEDKKVEEDDRETRLRKLLTEKFTDAIVGAKTEIEEILNEKIGGCFKDGVHYTDKNFLITVAADEMFATIREVEGENRTQCTWLLDGTCSSHCTKYEKCWWRKLRAVAEDYAKVRGISLHETKTEVAKDGEGEKAE